MNRVESELMTIIRRMMSDGTLKSAPYESIQSVLIARGTQLSGSIAIWESKR